MKTKERRRVAARARAILERCTIAPKAVPAPAVAALAKDTLRIINALEKLRAHGCCDCLDPKCFLKKTKPAGA